MIRLIEALNYRCLRYISLRLEDFQVMVGPNASGKTTFLDVVSFMGDLVSEGLEKAIESRTTNFQDLLWGRNGKSFELAMELELPQEIQNRLDNFSILRYEISIGLMEENSEIGIFAETVLLKTSQHVDTFLQRTLFPAEFNVPQSILTTKSQKESRTVVSKKFGGNDNFYSEVYGEGWVPSFKLGPKRSSLGNLPADESKFPAAFWLKELLSEGIQKYVLNSQLIRKASPPIYKKSLRSDGSNLPWIIQSLKDQSEQRFQDWISHLRTALPDLRNIRSVERADDKHRYLMLEYAGGLEVPSWTVSDGTLRLLALTLPAYLPSFKGILLIEEPENGIHPRAVEAMYQSLSSVYDAQILLATHSPVIISIADVNNILCFAKSENGTVDIVRGDEHPQLHDWQGEVNLSELFAAGVLG